MIETIITIIEWIMQNTTLLFSIGVFSVITFIGSLIAIPFLIISMNADYFETKKKDTSSRSTAFNIFAVIIIVLKNITGILFLIAGLLMLVLPGQGVISILIGMSLVNFPGKRKLEIKLIRLPAVHNAINWIRQKASRPPVNIPEN